jgi:C1A family cysteine protease
MNKFRNISWLSVSGALLLALLLVSCAFADATIFSSAPRNPEFLKLQQQGYRVLQKSTGPGGYPLGYRPSPLDLSHVVPPVSGAYAASVQALPAQYDLRDSGAITAVRNQNPYGTCWAFGTMASMESNFRKRGFGNLDFSEWHLAYFAYVDESPSRPAFTQSAPGFGDDPIFDQGGSHFQSAAILARWTGAVNETDRPYQNVSPWPPSSTPLASDPVAKHLEHVHFLGGPFNRDTIKQALMNTGAVSIRIVWNNSAYNGTTYAYYNAAQSGGGHMVTIAGWDDNYSAANFNTNPGSNGAWLVKNSWGTGWGNAGYFWLSYNDPTIGYPALFIGAENTNFERVYQYDPLGWTESVGASSNTGWFANIFTAAGAASQGGAGGIEVLRAVSFYAAQSNASYLIEVRKEVAVGAPLPRSGTLVNTTEGTLVTAGYHTVRLSSDVALAAGERFSIVVRLTTPGYNWPIAVEQPIPGYSEKATATSGQSFVSADGNSWTDMTAVSSNTNVCLKAFSSAGVPVTGVALSPASATLSVGQTASLTATVNPSNASDATVTWLSSNPSVATVTPATAAAGDISASANATVTAVAAGDAIITVRTNDGNFTASSTITVTAGGGGGGCSVAGGSALPAVLLLALPLAAILKKRNM